MRKQYSAQFKAEVVLELLREEKTIAEIAAERHVHPTMLHRWRKIALAELPEVFARGDRGSAERAEHEKKIHELYAQIGRLSTELEWMKKKHPWPSIRPPMKHENPSMSEGCRAPSEPGRRGAGRMEDARRGG